MRVMFVCTIAKCAATESQNPTNAGTSYRNCCAELVVTESRGMLDCESGQAQNVREFRALRVNHALAELAVGSLSFLAALVSPWPWDDTRQSFDWLQNVPIETRGTFPLRRGYGGQTDQKSSLTTSCTRRGLVVVSVIRPNVALLMSASAT